MSKKVNKNVQPEVIEDVEAVEIKEEDIVEEEEKVIVEEPKVKVPFWKKIPWKKIGKGVAIAGAIAAAAAGGYAFSKVGSDDSDEIPEEEYIKKLNDYVDSAEDMSIKITEIPGGYQVTEADET